MTGSHTSTRIMNVCHSLHMHAMYIRTHVHLLLQWKKDRTDFYTLSITHYVDLCLLFKSWSCHAQQKYETLSQCWFNVGPPSATVAQHWYNIASMYRVTHICSLRRAVTWCHVFMAVSCIAVIKWSQQLYYPFKTLNPRCCIVAPHGIFRIKFAYGHSVIQLSGVRFLWLWVMCNFMNPILFFYIFSLRTINNSFQTC